MLGIQAARTAHDELSRDAVQRNKTLLPHIES